MIKPKGQLISKGHNGRLGQKFEFSSSFFGRIGDTQYWTKGQSSTAVAEDLGPTAMATVAEV